MLPTNRSVRSLLSVLSGFNLRANLIGEISYQKTLVEQYIYRRESDRVLDIGCVTSDPLLSQCQPLKICNGKILPLFRKFNTHSAPISSIHLSS